jgi:hypothetical protein
MPMPDREKLLPECKAGEKPHFIHWNDFTKFKFNKNAEDQRGCELTHFTTPLSMNDGL